MKIRTALVLLVLLIVLPSCARNRNSAYQESRALIDTFVTVTVVSDSADEAQKAVRVAFAAIEEFGRRINFFSADSELSLINKNAGIKEIKVSGDTFDVIEKSLFVAERSEGAFDPTIGAVMKLWDFHENIKPEDAEVKKNLPLVNYRNVRTDRRRSTVFLTRKGMLLDLGGIAKGYAADLAVEALKKQGIRSGIVAVSGDIKTFGSRPDGKPWNIGIKNPRQKGEKDEIIASIPLSDRAISTAGDYERFFISNGQRYHHILDPATGYPAKGTRSVCVITDMGVFADGFDNAIFVLGPKKGVKLAEQLGRDFPVDVFIIHDDGTEYISAGIKGFLKHENEH